MKQKNNTKINKKIFSGISGWLLISLILFIFSLFNAFVLLIIRINAIINKKVYYGVYISVILLCMYITFALISTILIMLKKKSAIKFSLSCILIGLVFITWFYIFSLVLYYPAYGAGALLSNIANFIINAVIFTALFLYFKKSKRVKNTLVK
ncbi:MAG: hypothetical protein ACP5OG_06155 [Candidatus Nanoarchaeia archaeon]